MDKKKIYDKLTYPEILNMNKFFQNEFTKINDYFNPEMLKSLNERKIQNNQKEEIKSSMNEGNLVYELYAMLSHSGTANSGHYKAYIKSFENGICPINNLDKWYCFDDSIVFEIEKESFQHIFGGIVENGN
jgi:ubiquitin C-terminal hydrolase